MSAYVFDDDGYGAAAPTAMAPLERRFFGGDADFVCNVSDDDTVERDIDLEIEARIRSLTFLSDDDSALLSLSMASLQPPTAATPDVTRESARTPQLPRTLSQRMLSSLQKSKMSQSQRTQRSVSSVPQQRTRATPTATVRSTTPKAAVRAPPVRNERSFYPIDEAESASRGRGDSHATQLSGRSTSSCTDRLEARISKSFLNRQDSIEGAADANDFSAMYSGRRTYPAESVKKTDQRLSEGVPAPIKQDTRMMTALEKGEKWRLMCRIRMALTTWYLLSCRTQSARSRRTGQPPADGGTRDRQCPSRRQEGRARRVVPLPRRLIVDAQFQ